MTPNGLFIGKFRADPDPKDDFHPGNNQNVKERRVLDLLLPIHNPDKPKRISVTMANTLLPLPLYPSPLSALRLLHG